MPLSDFLENSLKFSGYSVRWSPGNGDTFWVRYDCSLGRRKVAVKVVDILGNDTMKILEVTV